MKEAIMSACEKGVSRRTVLLAAAAAAPVLGLMTTAAQAKLTQAATKYQAEPKEVNGDKRQCDGCNFFVAPNSCKMVDGEISPTGWCTLWVKKSA
jgi:hypothetical protein